MAKMNELAAQVKKLEDQLVTCIRCGTCQSVCPLFAQTRKEADVARGKLALLTGLMENMFDDPDGVNERLNKCLLCGSCAANCPSGVNVLEIFIRARAILAEYKGLSPAKKLIFKKMLANPGTFDTLVAWAGKFQTIFTRPDGNAQGTSCARLVSPLLANRHFLPLASTPFHAELPEQGLRKKGKTLKAAIFTGCLIDKVFPNVARATLKVLDHHGVGVVIPPGQGCCGIPALASGDRDSFTKLVDHNLALFEREDFDVLVTACATCTSTIKKLWPTVYKGADSGTRARLEALSKRPWISTSSWWTGWPRNWQPARTAMPREANSSLTTIPATLKNPWVWLPSPDRFSRPPALPSKRWPDRTSAAAWAAVSTSTTMTCPRPSAKSNSRPSGIPGAPPWQRGALPA